MKPICAGRLLYVLIPAAFRRLCVETNYVDVGITRKQPQPPSGGCVLKRRRFRSGRLWQFPAAFRRLCVETSSHPLITRSLAQPPSGGCVLKLRYGRTVSRYAVPAAFRRLCVETSTHPLITRSLAQPPSGGCVLKPLSIAASIDVDSQPPSGGCVLKRVSRPTPDSTTDPAAFRRLCVETLKSR